MEYKYFKVEFIECAKNVGFVKIPVDILENIDDHDIFYAAFEINYMGDDIPSYCTDNWVDGWDYTEVTEDDIDLNDDVLTINLKGTPSDFSEGNNKRLLMERS